MHSSKNIKINEIYSIYPIPRSIKTILWVLLPYPLTLIIIYYASKARNHPRKFNIRLCFVPEYHSVRTLWRNCESKGDFLHHDTGTVTESPYPHTIPSVPSHTENTVPVNWIQDHDLSEYSTKMILSYAFAQLQWSTKKKKFSDWRPVRKTQEI